MRLSDVKGEQALDILADIIEPAVKIMSDPALKKIKEDGLPMVMAMPILLRNHKRSIIEILAVLEGKPYNEYVEEVSLMTLPTRLLEMLNDPMLIEVFQSQTQTESTSFGSATENTEADEA